MAKKIQLINPTVTSLPGNHDPVSEDIPDLVLSSFMSELFSLRITAKKEARTYSK